jgi:hypothetical protein
LKELGRKNLNWIVAQSSHTAIMQKEELSDSRNRQAAPRNEGQNEDQIWQRLSPAFAEFVCGIFDVCIFNGDVEVALGLCLLYVCSKEFLPF